MTMEVLIKYFMTFAASLVASIMMCLVIMFPLDAIRARRITRTRITIFFVLSLALTTIIAMLLFKRRLQNDDVMAIFIIFASTIYIRLGRINKCTAIKQFQLNIFSLTDIALLAVGLFFLPLIPGGAYITYRTIYGYPAYLIAMSLYVIINFSILCPDYLKLCEWKILARAFSEYKNEFDSNTDDDKEGKLFIKDVIGWSMGFAMIGLSLLMGYRLSQVHIFVIIYVALSIALTIFLWKKAKSGKGIYPIIIGTGFASVLVVVSHFVIAGGVLFSEEPTAKLLVSICLSMPLIVLSADKVPELPHKMASVFVRRLSIKHGVRTVYITAHAALNTILDKRATVTIQAVATSIVFVFYYLLPKSQKLLEWAGVTSILSLTPEQFINKFNSIASTWSLPGGHSAKFDIVLFIFGNEGLVLLMLLWFLITIINAMQYFSYIEKIPDSPISSFLGSVAAFLTFIIIFLPLILQIALIIPGLGGSLVGAAVAILIGVFTFTFVLPRVVFYLLSLFVIPIILLSTDYSRDAVNINFAAAHDIKLLPKIDSYLAKQIIDNRPYNSVDELLNVKGMSGDIVQVIKPLIAF